MAWNITPAQSKQEEERCHSAEHQGSKGYISKCFGVFDCQLILKFFTARNIFMSPEIYSSLFFLKPVSFSCCLQLLTPIKCNWMCRKSKSPAAVVSSLIYILQNWNSFFIITDSLPTQMNWFAPAVPPGRGSSFGKHQCVCRAGKNMGGRGERTAE